MTVAAPAAPASRSWVPPRRDLALAVGVAVFEIAVSAVAAGHQDSRRGFDALAVGLLLAGALSLAWRGRAPIAVFGVVFATTLAYVVIGYPQGPIYLALIVAFCTTLLEGHRLVAWSSVPAGWALFLWLPSLVGTGDPPELAGVLGLAAWLLVLATTTEIVRIRRERTAEARRAREEEARLRASEEQLRIARELHDVVAHNLSLINVQAGTALHLIDERPELAESALVAIKGASKDALDELRALVDVLRSGVEVAPRLPTPTLADVDDLVERSSAAGVPVELRVRGTRRPLPHTIETAAYRVTQEALTNVARHAGATHTVVELDYEPDALVVRVEDDGRGPAGDGASTGKGLTGMRERVHALGGELEVGARGAHGFRVRARIPIGGTR
jgi:signal transduction histidine kinase